MAPLALKVKTKNGQQIINTLTPESTIIELKRLLSNVSKIPINRLHALSGYPPKILDFTRDTVQLVNCGIKSGDTLILEEKPESEQPSQPSGCTTKDITPSQPLEEVPAIVQGILMKHIVPADNSCLFTSINYVLSGKVDDTVAPFMRKLIAETITNAKEIYSEAILGKPVQDYCAWIQDDNSWGGAIELAILSNHYGVEIAVVDTINAIINRFGEDQNYPHRVFLMFDGIHYDPLYLEPFDGGKIRTIFPTDNEEILKDAQLLAQEAKSSKQYTDVNKFTLKCMDCNIFLQGQVQAQQHAQSSGHMNFGEVNQ